jgi:Fe2+ transport system protein FeoA
VTAVCPLCGFCFAPGGSACAERGCPWAGGSCRFLDCPRCGYAVPDETGSVLARLVRRLAPRRPPAERARATVADLRPGDEAMVERVEAEEALVVRLAAHGLVAGAALRLVERRPGHVVEVGETTIAFEERVARAIRLQTSRE